MKLIDIENYKSDLPGALKKASADVPVLEAAFKDAEVKLAAAESERQRRNKTYGYFVSTIPLLRDKYQDCKRRVLVLEVETAGQGDTQSGWTAYNRLKADWQHAVDAFARLSMYEQPNAELAYMEAEIQEREAYAALLEGQAARARCGVLVATMNAQKYDPGLQLDVSSSWSNTQSQKAHEIMTREIPGLREQLVKKQGEIERNRQAMDASILN